jgi:anti-sigma factor RsiW
VGSALGLSDKTKASVEKALTGNNLTPEQVASLQAADTALKQRLAELGIEAEKLAVQDRADARAMQVATHSPVPAVLAFTLVGTFLTIICMLLTGDMKLWDNQTLTMLLGQLTGAVTAVTAYYYGASHKETKP